MMLESSVSMNLATCNTQAISDDDGSSDSLGWGENLLGDLLEDGDELSDTMMVDLPKNTILTEIENFGKDTFASPSLELLMLCTLDNQDASGNLLECLGAVLSHADCASYVPQDYDLFRDRDCQSKHFHEQEFSNANRMSYAIGLWSQEQDRLLPSLWASSTGCHVQSDCDIFRPRDCPMNRSHTQPCADTGHMACALGSGHGEHNGYLPYLMAPTWKALPTQREDLIPPMGENGTPGAGELPPSSVSTFSAHGNEMGSAIVESGAVSLSRTTDGVVPHDDSDLLDAGTERQKLSRIGRQPRLPPLRRRNHRLR